MLTNIRGRPRTGRDAPLAASDTSTLSRSALAAICVDMEDPRDDFVEQSRLREERHVMVRGR